MQVRVSVANLVHAVVTMTSVGDVSAYVGILGSGPYKKGQLRLQPIGGACELREKGVKFLTDKFGAVNFHKSSEGGIDARFEIDDEQLEGVFSFFRSRDPEFFEIDPIRELREELSTVELKATDTLPEIPAILTPEEAGLIGVEYFRTVEQPFKDNAGTSTLAKEGVPSRRLFHQFNILVNEAIFNKMCESKALRILTDEEMASTGGGLHKGKTSDGVDLADNFIL